jgi:hypothetical protein
MPDFLTLKFDDAGAQAELDALAAKHMAAVRPAAQAGAQVLYDQVKLNVAGIGKVTGNLGRSIYQAFSDDNSTGARATYHVSWNASKAPHGHLVEYGHIQTRKVYVGSDGNWYTSTTQLDAPKLVGARPFLRPAFDAKGAAAAQAAKDRYLSEVRK